MTGRGLCTVAVVAKAASSALYRRLSGLKGGGSAAETVEEWVKEGNPLKIYNVKGYVRELRKYKRFLHALQLMEWMEAKGTDLSPSDYAVHIDLLSRTKGIDAAERYFTSLPEPAKNGYTYGALFSCYCTEKMLEKATTLFWKMGELNFASSTLNYNNLMSMYMKLGQPEMVPPLVDEMKAANVLLDSYTYAILMNSYAALKDIKAVERAMEEAKMNKQTSEAWSLYSNLVAIYISARLFVKANLVLKELEKIIDPQDRNAYHYLISLYAKTSDLHGVKRVWANLRSAFTTTINLSYFIMLQSLAKLNDLDGLRSCFEKWQSGCLSYDIRLPNVVISAYCKHGMIEEAMSLLKSIVNKGHEPNFWTMDILVDFYLKNNQRESALKCMKALVSTLKDAELKPCQVRVRAIFKHFLEQKDVNGAEEFFKMLKKVQYPVSKFYELLLRTYVAAGAMEPLMRLWLLEDKVQMSPQIEKLLERVCPV